MPRGRQKTNISKKNLIDKNIVGVRKKRTKSIVPRILKTPVDELSDEEVAERDKLMNEFLPKIDPNKKTIILNLSKNAEACREHTKGACFRPDIYLDYGCDHCSLVEHCACPIKKVKKKH
jgi:hypothetical protein